MNWNFIQMRKKGECLVIVFSLIFFCCSHTFSQKYSQSQMQDRSKSDLIRVMSGPDTNAIYLEIRTHRYDIKDAPRSYIYRSPNEVIVKMENFVINESPGDPALPYQVFSIAIPPDAVMDSLDVGIIEIKEKELKGTFNIAAAPPALLDQDTIQEKLKWELTKWGPGKKIVNGKNILIYEKDQYYPQQYCSITPGSQIRKWKSASVVYFPFRYNPVKKTLVFAEEIVVSISFKRDSSILQHGNMKQLLRDTKFDKRAKGIFINYDDAVKWYKKALKSLDSKSDSSLDNREGKMDPDYAIITTDAIYNNSTRLADFCFHKQDQGFLMIVVTEHATHTVTGSPAGYSFIDGTSGYEDVIGEAPNGTEEKIRKWLQDNYLALGIEYVLLVGNPDPDNPEVGDAVGDIPMQLCWTYIIGDYPTDTYFADLTGDWNLDKDDYIGELYKFNPAIGYAESSLPPGINSNLFCVRWEGAVEVTGATGTASIYIYGYTEGKTKIWLDVDNNGIDAADLLVDDAGVHHPSFVSGNRNLPDGIYPIRIEYLQSASDAFIQIFTRTTTAGVTASFKHDDGSGTYVDLLEAEYFNDNNFSAPADVTVTENPYVLYVEQGDRGSGGVDFGPEVIVGRIPFYSEDEDGDGNPDYNLLDNIFEKMISYENADIKNEDWRHRVLISTPYMYSDPFTGNITIADYEGGEYLRDHIATLPFWEWYRIHDEDYGVGADVTAGCSYNETVDGWNDATDPDDGRGVVMWRTHGWQTGAVKVFEESRIPELDDSKPSIVIQTTCQNGHPEAEPGPGGISSYPLGYSLLKHGAVGTFCATRNSSGGTFDPTSIDINYKNNPYLMYFLAKGVMDNVPLGDVLFHVKYNDATLGSYWSQIFNYNLYGDPTLSLFGRNPKSNNDVVFLLDGSGSMLSEGKWDAAKDGAVLFYDLMKALRHPTFEDKYNAVVFRWPCGSSSTDETVALTAAPGLKDISVPLTLSDFSPYTPIGSYCTPLGRGLEVAIDQFETSTEESFYSNKTILLLTDGKHNKGIDPLSVTIPEGAGIKVQAVGLGEDYIEPDRIRDIANVTGGDYRISPSPREMEDFFCQILCNTSWKLQDIPVTASMVPIDQNTAAFIVVWDDPSLLISFNLNPPGSGPDITPSTLGTAYPGMTVTYHAPTAGEKHAFYLCKDIPSTLLGNWEFTNINNGGAVVTLSDVLLKVIEDPRIIADFNIGDTQYRTGQPIMLTAFITEDGKPMLGLSDIYADLVTSPALSVGDLMSENTPSPQYLKSASVKDGSVWSNYLMGIMEKLGMKTLNNVSSTKIILKDNGMDGDLKKDDGIYTGYYTDTQYEGSYTFEFRAKGKNKDNVAFNRGETLSEYVKFGADPEKTEIRIISQSSDPGSGIVTATIQLTPRDKFGHLLGPMRGKILNLWSSSGQFKRDTTGKLLYEDQMDGSYVAIITLPEGEDPVVTVSVGDVITSVNEMIEETPSWKRWSISAHAGIAVPNGNFARDYDPGFHLVMDADFHFTPDWSAVLNLGYNNFKVKSSGVNKNNIFNVSANGRYTHFSRNMLSIYLQGGPGLYIPDIGKLEMGGNIGLGFDYHFNPNLDLELGADYHSIFNSDIHFIQTQLGIVYKFNL